MRVITVLFLSILCWASVASAKSGYQIELELENFEEKEIILASYYGSSNKIVDTFAINKKGTFILKGDEPLEGGAYLIILPPENKFFEIIVDKEQVFSLKCDPAKAVETMKVKGSEENRIFYDYLRFLAKKRIEAEAINKKMEAAKTDEEKKKINSTRDKLDKDVSEYFQNIITKYPHSIMAIVVNAAKPPVDMPKSMSEADDTERYRYYKLHYFDNMDLGDERLLRTNFLFKRVEYYTDKLTPQIPDSINLAIDYILAPMKKDGDMFKYYLVYFLNKYAKSKVVGMDAVYVYIVENYYMKGLAPWTDKVTQDKIIKTAMELKPILIGKPAPNIRLKQKDGTPLAIEDIAAEYIILYFWDPDCGHCKKASPEMIAFQTKYEEKGVKLLGICTEIRDDVKKCWETIDERGYNWLNLVDPYLQSRYKTLYNIKSTPQIFILDKNKKIIMKRIGAEQLGEVMDKIIERDQKLLKKKKLDK